VKRAKAEAVLALPRAVALEIERQREVVNRADLVDLIHEQVRSHA
jgi:hypothetical protein